MNKTHKTLPSGAAFLAQLTGVQVLGQASFLSRAHHPEARSLSRALVQS